MADFLSGFALFFALSTCVVLFSGVVPREQQTWGVILAGAIGIPVFLVLMAGFLGVILG